MINKEDIKRSVLTTSIAVSKEIVVSVLEELKRKKLEDIVRTNFGFFDIHDLVYALELVNEEKKPEPVIPGAAGQVQSRPPLVTSGKQAVHKDGKRLISKRI